MICLMKDYFDGFMNFNTEEIDKKYKELQS
jgi:hypothetical protein